MNTPLRRLAIVVALLFISLLVSTTLISYVRADELNERPGNSRTLLKELGRERGPILVAGEPVARSVPVEDAYEFQREYTSAEVYAHLTGHFSVIFGATGMESAEADILSGTADALFYRRISDLVTGAQPRGGSVELTIDPAVQQVAFDALGNQRGAVVALDPRTGDVLAMVSKPTYDPNILASHDGEAVRAAREALLADAARPLDNRAIASRLYPPGSVFKLVTSAAALAGGATPETELAGPAELDLPQTDTILPNIGGGDCGDGTVTLTQALQISCNTAFGGLGLSLGGNAIRDQAQAFGFGQDLRIPLRVTPSSVPSDMNPPQSAQAAIGQFDVRVSPLQVAMVGAGIANDGVVMRPRLTRSIRDADLDVITEASPEEFGRAVSPEVADQLTQMMVAVVADGTGRNAAIDGVAVAGKTGTAQHAPGRPAHAWFTAFAPAEDPRVAVAVVVEEGGDAGDEASGGRTAAPIARQVIEAVLQP